MEDAALARQQVRCKDYLHQAVLNKVELKISTGLFLYIKLQSAEV